MRLSVGTQVLIDGELLRASTALRCVAVRFVPSAFENFEENRRGPYPWAARCAHPLDNRG